MKLGASLGMGLAYAGCKRGDIRDILAVLINDENLPVEVSATAALSLGLNFVATRDEDSINTILSSLMAFSPDTLKKDMSRFYGVALGLLFLGEGKEADTLLETLDSVEHPIGKYSKMVVETCSQIGHGNVLKIQEYLNLLN